MKNHSMNPVAVFAFVFIYYFLKFGLLTAGGGASMAVVEGVSSGVSGYSTARKAMLISPVFVYLAFAILHIAFELLQHSTKRLEKAVERTFQFHLAFFAVSIGAFLTWTTLGLEMAQSVHAFQESTLGGLIFATGTWLPVILIGFFIWRYANERVETEARSVTGEALQETYSG